MTAHLSIPYISPLYLFSIQFHLPCLHTVRSPTQPQLSISFTYPLTIHHFTQFLGTTPLVAAALSQGSFLNSFIHSNTHSYTRVSSISIIHCLPTLSHSFILPSFSHVPSSPLTTPSPTAASSQHCCSSLLCLREAEEGAAAGRFETVLSCIVLGQPEIQSYAVS